MLARVITSNLYFFKKKSKRMTCSKLLKVVASFWRVNGNILYVDGGGGYTTIC